MSKDTVRGAERVEKRKSGETEAGQWEEGDQGADSPRGKARHASWGSRPSHERALTSGLTLWEGREVSPAPGLLLGPSPPTWAGSLLQARGRGTGAGLQEGGVSARPLSWAWGQAPGQGGQSAC